MRQPALPATFTCDVRPDRERVIVHLCGELDLICAPEVQQALEELLSAGFEHIVVDLRQLRFLDSTGLSALLAANHSGRERGCDLTLIRGPDAVQRIFEITGLEAEFAFQSARFVA